MVHPHVHDHEVHVREVPIPGRGRLFDLSLGSGERVSIDVDPDSGERTLSITPSGVDEPVVSVRCSVPEATTLAALLAGVRFVVEDDDHQPVDAANLRTVTLGAGSPAVGQRVADLVVPDPDDAVVIAVIRDDTRDLVETDPDRPCQPGDRLVLVGRPGSMSRLVRYLTG